MYSEFDTQIHQASLQEFLGLYPQLTHAEAQYYLETNGFSIELALESYQEDPERAKKNILKKQLTLQYKQHMTKNKNTHNPQLVRRVKPEGATEHIELRIAVRSSTNHIINDVRPGEMFLMEIGAGVKGVNFQEGGFEDCVRIAYENGKPLLVLGYAHEGLQKFERILNNQNVAILNNSFICLGLLKYFQQYDLHLKDYVMQCQRSSLTVLRVDFMNQVKVLSQFELRDDIEVKEFKQYLRNTVTQHSQQRTLEQEVEKDYELQQAKTKPPTVYPQYFHHQDSDDEKEPTSNMDIEEDYEYERQLKQMQEREFEESKLEHQKQLLKQKQETEKKRKQSEAIQQLQEQRKLRKLSLPEQPQEQHVNEIMTFAFRLPQGGRLIRKFSKQDLIDLIFNFVELNEDIKFEDELNRHFDLVTIDKHWSLMDKKDRKIGDVFAGEIQETLLIKEL